MGTPGGGFYGDEVDPQCSILLAAITGTTLGTATPVITPDRNRLTLLAVSSLDQSVVLTYNGLRLLLVPAGTVLAVDFKKFDRSARAGRVIGAYHLGVLPAAGHLGVTLL